MKTLLALFLFVSLTSCYPWPTPDFGQQFTTTIIEVIGDEDAMKRVDFFDYIGQRERIDYYYEGGEIITFIYDYNMQLQYQVNHSTKECTQQPMETNYLPKYSWPFLLSYNGTAKVDGIECNVWIK
jgi:hypothetical protein